MRFKFETVDVFTESRFGGNPLAVFPDASGLSVEEMQLLAAEFNLSETTFVLPPMNPRNTARVRIFNRTEEMPFAGHPLIGTAFVLARAGSHAPGAMRFEVPAGIVAVEIERIAGIVAGGRITAPQPLSIGSTFLPEEIACCVGLVGSDIQVAAHPPILVSVGNSYVIAEVTDAALSRSSPDVRRFAAFRAAHSELRGRFSLHLYARNGADLRARMFAPLAGTVEDPATGSANAPLAALLLSLARDDYAEFNIRQGEEMGRPSRLFVTAKREAGAITATVAGRCVPVLSGEALVGPAS